MRLLFAVLVGIAVAARFGDHINAKWFSPGNEFVYSWESQLATGLSADSAQHATQRISARLHMQIHEKNIAIVALKNIAVFAAQGVLRDSAKLVATNFLEPLELSPEQLEALALPVRFPYEAGRLSELEFDARDPHWSRNIKRSALNLLQVSNKQSTDRPDETMQQYRKEETTVEGVCDSVYTRLSKNGDDTDETVVTKSIDFTKCSKRPAIVYSLRFDDECAECDEHVSRLGRPLPALEHSTVMRFVVRDEPERFLIREAELTSKYVYSPLSDAQPLMKTDIVARLVLLQSAELRTKLSAVNAGAKTTLMHSLDVQRMRERWEMTGDAEALEQYKAFGKYDEIEAGKNTLNILNQQLSERIEVESTSKFGRLVTILRRCSSEQIQKLHQEANKINEKLSTLFVDAVAESGTYTCVQYLVELAIKEEISPLRTAYLLKTLPNMRTPSQKIIDIIGRLAEDVIAKKNPVLEQSARLTQGALINILCTPSKREQWAHERDEVCPREVRAKYVEELAAMFARASTRYEKTLALKTAANAALEASVPRLLERVAFARGEEPAVRAQALDALRLLRTRMPRRLQKTLLPVALARREPTELRVTAAFHLLHTQPERHVLDQLLSGVVVGRGRNAHVAAYVLRMVQAFASGATPCEREFAARCVVALRGVDARTQHRLGRLRSGNSRLAAGLAEGALTAGALELSRVFSNESVLPKELMASLNAFVAGHWNKNLLQLGVVQTGLDRLLDELAPKAAQIRSVDDVITRGKRSIFESPKQLLQGIFNKINIVARGKSAELESDPHALVYIRYRNLDYAFIPLNEDVILQLLKDVTSGSKLSIYELEKTLATGVSANTHTAGIAYSVFRILPTTFGMPLAYNAKMPFVASLKLSASVDLLPLGSASLNGAKLQISGSPAVTVSHLAQAMVPSPFVQTGLRLQNSVLLSLPLEASLNVKYENGKLSTQASFRPPRAEHRLFKAVTRPVTYVRKIQAETVKYVESHEETIHAARLNSMLRGRDLTFGEAATGLRFSLTGNTYTQFGNGELLPIVAAAKQMEINVRPTSQTPKEYKVSTLLELFAENTAMPEERNFRILFKAGEKRQRFDSSSEEQDAAESQLRDVSGSRVEHRLTTVVEAVGGDKQRKAELELRANCEETSAKTCVFSLLAKRTPLFESERAPCKADASLYTLLPREAQTVRDLKLADANNMRAVLRSSFGCETSNKLNINFVAEQNNAMREFVKRLPSSRNEADGFEQLKRAGYLNEYNFEIDYDLSKEQMKFAEHARNILVAMNYWNSEETSATHNYNKVNIKIDIEPENHRVLNVSVYTPESKLRVEAVRLPFKLPLLNIFHANELRAANFKINHAKRATCEITASKIRSFDDVVFGVPLTNCYSVIAKDCSSSEPSFAVYAKQLDRSSRMLRVVSEDGVIEMWPERDDAMRIHLNGKRLSEDSLAKAGIVKIADGIYKIELPKLSVRFNGVVVRVDLSEELRGRQCGLCGHYDDNEYDEFRRADNKHTDDLEEFHRSYLIRDEKCDVDESVVSDQSQYAKYDASFEEGVLLNELVAAVADAEEEPIERQHVLEYAHRTCFSRTAAKECAIGSGVRSERATLRFVCFDRDSKEALRITKQIHRGGFAPLDSYADSFTQSVKSAIKCRA